MRSGSLKIAAQRGFDRAFLDFFAEVSCNEPTACGEALKSARRVVVEDVTESDIFNQEVVLAVLRNAGVRAVQSSPLISSEGHVLGMISTHYAEPRRPTERALLLFDLLVRQAADFLERKRIEGRLAESQKTLFELVERAPFGIYVVDSHFRIAHMNATSRTGAFRNVTPVIGRDFSEAMHILWPAEIADQIVSAFHKTLETGEPYYSANFTRPRADTVIIESYEWELHRLLLPDGEHGVICYYYNSTKLRQAERALAESEERFRTLANSIPQLVWMARPDGQIFWYNDRWYEYAGAKRAASEGERGWEHAVDPREVPRVLTKWKAALATGVNWEDVFSLRRHDGELRAHLSRAMPFRDSEGRITLWFGTSTDVAERDRLLRTFDTVLASLEEFVYLLDLDGRFTYANKPLIEFWQKNLAEIIGKTFAELDYLPELAELHALQLTEVIRTRQPVRGEARYASPGGRTGDYTYIFVPLLAANGSVEAIGGAARDVTEQRRHEAAREELLASERAARTEAERVSRMKDEFLATLSHELRTPLNAILGWSYLLSRNNVTNEDYTQAVEAISRNARAQAKLIEDLLDMSRIINGKIRLDMQNVKLSEVIREAMAGVQLTALSKGIELETELDPNTIESSVLGDRTRLQQALWNLLTNALKFTPRGGRVRVSLRQAASHLELSVSDTGRGISPDVLPRVFDRFWQEEASITRKHGGLGLGLAIVKQLVELHGGTVRAMSPGEGMGATFVISLPLWISSLNPEVDQSPKPGAFASVRFRVGIEVRPSLSGVRIFVIEDNTDAQEFVRRVLEEAGATVWSAGSAEEGLSMLQRERPTVLCADIAMPVVDGFEFLRRVRALPVDQGGATPAIALTAYVRGEDGERALSAGFQMHLPKPVEPIELVTACANLAEMAKLEAI
jgi:PAS domain S-box-containing protein